MKTQRQALGAWGEEQAQRYLEGVGYQVLEHNVRTAYGEIDLVARQWIDQNAPLGAHAQGWMTVFVEVKTRRSTGYGMPEDSVTLRKQEHMLAAAQAYMQAHPELGDDWRLDVIAIQRLPGERLPQITHFENVIS